MNQNASAEVAKKSEDKKAELIEGILVDFDQTLERLRAEYRLHDDEVIGTSAEFQAGVHRIRRSRMDRQICRVAARLAAVGAR